MPGQNKNIIQKQIIDLVVYDQSRARQYYDDVRHLYYTELLPVIDEVLSEFSGNNQHIIIDNLYLDLGHIQASNLRSSLKLIFKKHLSDYLKTNIEKSFSTISAKPFTFKAQKSRDLDLLVYFLKTGNIPWWANHDGKIEWEKIWLSLLNEDTHRLFKEIKIVIGQNSGFERIVSFLNNQLFFKTVSKFSPLITKKIVTVVLQLFKIIPSISKISYNEILTVFKKSYFKIINETEFSDFHQIKIHLVISEFITMIAFSKNIPVKKIISEFYLVEMEKAKELIPKEVFVSIKKELFSSTQIADDKLIEEKIKELKFEKSQKKAKQKVGSEEDIYKRKTKKTNAEKIEKSDIGALTDPISLKGPEKETGLQKELNKPKDITGDISYFYIRNAGLALLWPYLKNFYLSAGLMKTEGWASPKAKQLAVHALQYMANGNNPFDENECLLSKILCGFQYDDFIDNHLKLNKKIKFESERLLKAVIKNWSVLKNTSVGGFRNSFLLREGKLEQTETEWKLTVQQKSHDVLLDKLPWTISIIKLSWMDKPIYVEW